MSFRKKEEWKRLLRPVCRLVFAETLLLVCSASHASCTVLNIELRIVGSNKRLFPSGTSLDLRGHMRAENCLKPNYFI